MRYRTLGRTGLKVSLLSMGTGGPSNLGQSEGRPLSPAGQDSLIRRCLDLGINLFDTSVLYGESEAILGRALKEVPRDSYILSTKWWGNDRGARVAAAAEALTVSVEASLRRLGTDYVDIMMFHGPLPAQYDQIVERYYPEMERLRERGMVRFIGLSVPFAKDPRHETAVLALTSHPELWDTVMLKYGILNQRAAAEALPLAMEHGVGILNMAAVRIKLPRPDQLEALIERWQRSGAVPAGSLPTTNPLGWLVHDEVDSVISAGYKFAADHPAVSTVLTGTSNVEHLEENVAALAGPFLPGPDRQRLIELFGIVAEYA